MNNLRDLSKKRFQVQANPSQQDIQTSAFVRIADSLEVMSVNYADILKKNFHLEKLANDRLDKIRELEQQLRNAKSANTQLRSYNEKLKERTLSKAV